MIDFEDFDEDSDCDKPLEKYPQMILMIWTVTFVFI